MSNRLVDGKHYYVPGEKVKGRAACPSAKDKKEAQQGLYSFDYQFQLAKNYVLSISNLGFDIESYSSFNKMTFILPSASLPIDGVNDFTTTNRYPLAIQIFSLLPVTSSSTSHPMNSFHDSPTTTRACPLKFCCKSPKAQYVTSFPPNSVIRHDSGSVILDSSGELVGARCSKSIPNRIRLELLSIYNQMESHRLFLVRGK
jgi:hypothetical protein